MKPIEVWNDDAGGCKQVGRLLVNPGRGPGGIHLTFQYESGWLAGGFAIDPENLPLASAPFHSTELFPAVSDAGPDRWGCILIDRRNRGSGKSLNAVDYVLGLSDQTRIGALRFKPVGAVAFSDGSPRPVPPILILGRLLAAADAVGKGTDGMEDIELLLGSGSPPGGARPKASVQDRDGSLAIAKFPKHDDTRSIARGEITALSLARKAGITTAFARLEVVKKRDIAIISRFDRSGGVRIPYISARTLIGAGKDDVGSYVEIAEAILRHGVNLSDRIELWRRLVFGRMVSNCDDHLRNHGFLRRHDGWALSPAFDLNPMPEAERRQQMATPVGPDLDGGIDAALSVLPAFGLGVAAAKEILRGMVQVVRKWRQEPSLDREAALAYESAFDNEEVAAAEKLSA
jgi:serine/threonine-protein kinase HipA